MQKGRHGRTTATRAGTAGTSRAKQRAYLHRRAAGGRRPLRAARAAAHRRASTSSARVVQHRDRPHPNTYLGPGKLEEVKAAAKAADANLIACDDELSPRQERNLEQALAMPVVDRTAMILDIFAGARAHAPRASSRSSSRSSSTTSPACAGCGPTSSAWAASRAAASGPAARASRRSRPTAAWRATGSRRCAGGSRASRARGRRCGPSATARTCRRSRWPATRTPASRRCSTR